MTEEATPDLSLIALQQRQILTELGTKGDDMGVIVPVLKHLDGTVGGLVNDVRAMHSQHARLGRRIADLEAKP